MKLRILERGQNRVAALIDDDGCCEVLKFLSEIAPNHQASAKGFKPLFRRYAEDGRQRLTTDTFHHANAELDIWEFIKGQLRVYCFRDADDQLIILSHGVVKKTQKAKSQDIQRAVSLRQRYLTAKQEGILEVSDHGT